MRIGIPGSCQGQIVEVGYGWNNGDIVRWTVDKSDQTSAGRIVDPWPHVEVGGAREAFLLGWDPCSGEEAPPWLDRLLDEEGDPISALPDLGNDIQ